MTALVRETLRYLGNAASDRRLLDLINSVLGEVDANLRPRSACKRLLICVQPREVLCEGFRFQSAALSKALAGCREAFFLAATLGAEADMLLRRYAAIDLPRAAVWQAACAAYLEAYLDRAEAALLAQVPGLYLRPRFSPGYGDFGVSNQRAMFALLDLERRLGLSLTDGCMMMPEKSVTAVIGIASAPCEAPRGCAACAKEDCPNRRTNA